MNTQIPQIGVGVIVIKDGCLLMGRRVSSHGKNTWSPPGGKPERHESIEATALRETKEE